MRDTPLANCDDDRIAQHIKQQRLTFITRDFDFADERAYPPEQYTGIVVLTLPETADAALVTRMVVQFSGKTECLAALPGRLAIVEFGRVRLRPMPPESV